MEIRSDISEAVHDLRSLQLKKLPKGADVFLTAGASGSWYFDWVRSSYGPVRKHIAVEKYSPRPAVLPEEVEWIAETVGNMQTVESNTVDLVFSGQNIEHLLVPEIIGFLMEASRVLRSDGLLVVDSPNRVVTSKAGDAHPEHVIEFTASEIRSLLEAAGFEVVKVEGLFVCSDPQTGEWLSLGVETVGLWDYKRRASEGQQHPDSCYIWWAEARKKSEPNRELIERIALEVYDIAWPERLARTHSIIGKRALDAQGHSCFDIPALTAGAAMFGPYAPLERGLYEVVFSIQSLNRESVRRAPKEEDREILTLEIFCDRHDPEVVCSRKVLRKDLPDGSAAELSVVFRLQDLTFGVQFRVLTNGSGPALRILSGCRVRRIA